MRAISHRGLWSRQEEKNTLGAFARSFEAGFGAEVDVRDHLGELVVSHDPPRGNEPRFTEVLALHRRLGSGLPLAVNIKSCGLAVPLADLLGGAAPANHFVFDAAVPDLLALARHGLRAFTRQSEYEPQPAAYALATGVWMDCFQEDWIEEEAIAAHLGAGKAVCLVSPELHGRPHEPVWSRWSKMGCLAHPALSICTDHPEAARRALGNERSAQ